MTVTYRWLHFETLHVQLSTFKVSTFPVYIFMNSYPLLVRYAMYMVFENYTDKLVGMRDGSKWSNF